MKYLSLLILLPLYSCGSLVDIKYVAKANYLCKQDSGLNYILNNDKNLEVTCINKKTYFIKKENV